MEKLPALNTYIGKDKLPLKESRERTPKHVLECPDFQR